jgi:hypothetical protein
MVRIMTWNCLGMEDPGKRALLQAYVTLHAIDYVILQEGSATFTNAIAETNNKGSYFIPEADCSQSPADKQVVSLAFGSSGPFGATINGAAGVSRAAYYNSLGTPAAAAGVHDSADYQVNPALREWIYAPAKNSSIRRPKLVGGTRARLSITNREDCDRYVTRPIQARVNLLSHRRPKVVVLAAGGVPFTLYYWHASLGGAVRLADVGLLAGNQAIAGMGCGGELAVAANLVLNRHLLDPLDKFPARTLLVGDLNITGAAADHIYRGRRVSSEEDWCHAIAPADATLTLLPNSNTMANALALGGSDHAPIVFDLTF